MIVNFNTLKDLLVRIIGTYTPQTGDGFGSVDIVWVMSSILFIVIVVNFFKFLYGLFR